MYVYLVKTNGNNMVVFTDGETAKCFDCATNGKFANIDIYSDNAASDLTKYFTSCEFVDYDYDDIYSPTEISYDEFVREVSEKILVWDGGANA